MSLGPGGISTLYFVLKKLKGNPASQQYVHEIYAKREKVGYLGDFSATCTLVFGSLGEPIHFRVSEIRPAEILPCRHHVHAVGSEFAF